MQQSKSPVFIKLIEEEQNPQQQQQQQQPLQMTPQTVGTKPRPAKRISRFSLRPRPFKAAMGGLVSAVFLFAVGFFAPAWYGNMGLWMACQHDGFTQCWYIRTQFIIGWLEAVKIAEVLALTLLVVSLAVEVYRDVLKSSSPFSPFPADNRAVEILAALGGLLGLVGVTVYGAETKGDLFYGYFYESEPGNLNWAFWLTAVACVLALVSALVMTLCRSPRYADLMTAAICGASASATSQCPTYDVTMRGYVSTYSVTMRGQASPGSGTSPFPMYNVRIGGEVSTSYVTMQGQAVPRPGASQFPACDVMMQGHFPLQYVTMHGQAVPQPGASQFPTYDVTIRGMYGADYVTMQGQAVPLSEEAMTSSEDRMTSTMEVEGKEEKADDKNDLPPDNYI